MISARQTSAACWITRWTSTHASDNVNRPVVARVISSRSSINRASSLALRWIIARVDRTSALTSSCSRRSEVASKMGVSGVRSSWLKMA